MDSGYLKLLPTIKGLWSICAAQSGYGYNCLDNQTTALSPGQDLSTQGPDAPRQNGMRSEGLPWCHYPLRHPHEKEADEKLWQQGKRRTLQGGRASGLSLCGHSRAWRSCHTADHPSHLLLCLPSQLSKGSVRNCPQGTHRAHFSLLLSLCPCMLVPPQAPLGAQEGRERSAQRSLGVTGEAG